MDIKVIDHFFKVETDDGVFYVNKPVVKGPEIDEYGDKVTHRLEMKEVFTGAICNIIESDDKGLHPNCYLDYIYIDGIKYYAGMREVNVGFEDTHIDKKIKSISPSELETEVISKYGSFEEAKRNVEYRLRKRHELENDLNHQRTIIASRRYKGLSNEDKKNKDSLERIKKFMQ